MPDGCIGNCLLCGKCSKFSILDGFSGYGPGLEPRSGFGVAADIGTTSVVLALLDLSTGRVLARHSFMNPQREFGPDVISRISAANNGRLEDMHGAITESIASGIFNLAASCHIQLNQIVDIAIAGNTVMTYLMLGLPCINLGAAPFTTEFQLAEGYNFEDIFGAAGVSCPVRIAPWFSAFVGGDIMAGLLHVMCQGKCRFLLIDLGTNGEMALYDNGRIAVTSTAAGPAFEGGSRRGASEVIKALAELILKGYVDETGLLSDVAPQSLSQKEIRDIQLAKAAVRSGLEILLESMRLNYGSLDAVYLAGGIGQAIDIESAVASGILHPSLRGICCASGNSSLGGAVCMLLSPERAATDIKKLLSAYLEINLATQARFSELFMKNLYFEHAGGGGQRDFGDVIL